MEGRACIRVGCGLGLDWVWVGPGKVCARSDLGLGLVWVVRDIPGLVRWACCCWAPIGPRLWSFVVRFGPGLGLGLDLGYVHVRSEVGSGWVGWCVIPEVWLGWLVRVGRRLPLVKVLRVPGCD